MIVLFYQKELRYTDYKPTYPYPRKEEMKRHKVKKRKLSTSSSNSQESTSQSTGTTEKSGKSTITEKPGKSAKSNSSGGHNSKLPNGSDGPVISKSSVNGAPTSGDKLSVSEGSSSNNNHQLSVKEEVQSEDDEMLESSIPCIRYKLSF